MDPDGLANKLAELVEQLKQDNTRDEVSALIAVKHCLKMFHELQTAAAEKQELKKLRLELRATQRLIKQDHGGASLSFENPATLPREGSGEPN